MPSLTRWSPGSSPFAEPIVWLLIAMAGVAMFLTPVVVVLLNVASGRASGCRAFEPFLFAGWSFLSLAALGSVSVALCLAIGDPPWRDAFFAVVMTVDSLVCAASVRPSTAPDRPA